MRLFNLLSPLLLGISITSVALAQPLDDTSDLEDRSFVLDVRGLTLKVAKEPNKEATCPHRDRVGNFGPYAVHKYTKGQIKAAFLKGAKLAADGKQVGDSKCYFSKPQGKTIFALRIACLVSSSLTFSTSDGLGKYPHVFGNAERLPFPCGKNKMEFPITLDNHVYDGGPSDGIPDRVVFEYRKTKKQFIVGYCGVMRHGPQRDFLRCP